MEKSPARKALEHYFAARLELRQQLESGVLDNLHYNLKKNHYRDRLCSVKPGGGLAHDALCKAVLMCDPAGHLTGDDREAARRLKKYDPVAYRAWRGEWMKLNVETTAYRILETYESVKGAKDIPIPAPDPEKVEAYESARNHRLGPAVEKKVDQHQSDADQYEKFGR